MALTVFTQQQVLAQLNSNLRWTGNDITYTFPTTVALISDGGTGTAPYFSPVPVAVQPRFELAMRLWDDLIPQSFKRFQGTPTSPSSSSLEFGYYTRAVNGYDYAFASYPTNGSAWFITTASGGGNLTNPVVGNYAFGTLLHEIGHAIGLRHMGNYNGAAGTQPSSYQDSKVYTQMSYYGPAGARSHAEVASADWVGSDLVLYSGQTPMLFDILAIQTIYGVSTTTRIDNTVYGFHTTLAGDAIYDFDVNKNPILSIFDSAGNDTIDLSGFSSRSQVSLVPGDFSSANHMTFNLSIAYSTWIENAVTGSGNDQITGNELANILDGGVGNDELIGDAGNDDLKGGSGNDTIDGGAGTDRAIFNFARTAYSVSAADASGYITLTSTQEGSDRIRNVETFVFTDGTFTLDQLRSTDLIAPTLASSTPAANQTGVSPQANLILTFSEAVQAGSGDIVIFSSAGTRLQTIAVGDAAQVSFNGAVVTINPTQDLAANQSFLVGIDSTALKDRAGNNFAGLAGGARLAFQTGAATDISVPLLLSTAPADNATTVAISSTLGFTFNEPVQRGSGTIVISRSDGTVWRSIAVSDTAQVAINGSQVIVTPSAGFEPNTSYYVNMAAGVIKDSAGNNFAGISGSTAFNFTTLAVTDDFPFATSTTGVVAVGGAATNGRIEVNGDTDLFRVQLVAGNTYTFDLTGSGSPALSDPYLRLYSASGATLTQLAFDDDSGPNNDSRIVYAATTSGTYYLGASGYSTATGGYALSAVATDTTAPTLSTTSPADNATGVAVGANLVLTFSETVQRGSGNVTIHTSDGTVTRTIPINDTAQISIAGSVVTVNPSADLVPGTAYYVNLAAGAFLDAAGNGFAGIGGSTAFNFTTLAIADDYPWNTGTTGVATVNGSATPGRVEVVRDGDLFRVNLVAGTTYIFEAASAASDPLTDPYLSLLNAELDLLGADDDSGGGSTARITFTAGSSGVYYLGVRDNDAATGNYLVSARTVVDDYPWATSTTGVVTVGAAATAGAIEVSGDRDMLKLNLVSGSTYVIDVVRTTSDGLSDPYVQLFDPASTQIAADNDGGGSLNSRITYAAASTGTYYVGVSDFSSGRGGYTVRATLLADVIAPTLVSSVPVDNAVGIAAEANLALSFSEAVQRGSGNVVLYNANGSVAQTVAITDTARVTVAGTQVTIDWPSDLTAGGNYYVGMASGVVRDIAGNPFAGISSTTVLNFTVSGDDYPWATNTTGVVTVNAAASPGTIEVAGDGDMFRVNLAAGTTYTFNLVPAANNALDDPFLILFDASLTQLASDDDGGDGLASQIVFTATTSGSHYLGARHFASGTGSYLLSASAAADDYPWDTGTPGVLSVGGSASNGRIETVSDADLFRVTLTAGVTYVFDAMATATGGLADPYLYLFSPTVALLASDDDGGGKTAARISYTAATSGTYYVGVSDQTTGTGSYTVRAAVAADVTVPTLVSTTPTDNAVDVAIGANIVLSFSEPVQRGSGSIVLSNTDGTSVRTISINDTAQVSINGTVLTIDPSSDLLAGQGWYVTMASGVVRDTAGNNFAGIAGTTAFNFNTLGVADDYPYTTNTTGVVTVGAAASTGRIETAGDQDLFKVNLVVGTAYVFDATAAASNGLSDPYLYLYSPGFVQLSLDDDGGDGNASRISFTATSTGTHYLGVRDFDSGTGNYLLTARQQTDDFPWDTGTPGVVTVGGSAVGGVIETNGDDDLFRVTLTAGTTYVIDAVATTSGGLADPYLYLFNPAVAQVASDDNGGGKTAARIIYSAPSSGTYYIGVSDASAGTGAYTVRAAVFSDTTAPTLVSLAPADNATGVLGGTNLVLTFNESVQRGSGNITIHNANGSVAQTIAVTDTTQVSLSGAVVTINPSTDLSPGTSYYVNIAAGAVRDLANNSFAGISGSTAYNFTTASDDYPWSTGTTGVVTVNGTAASGTIEISRDLDLFKVDLSAGVTYTFDAIAGTTGGLADPYLYLYGPTPDVLLIASNDNGGGKTAARISYTATSTGTYYVGVGDAGSGIGTYRVSATAAIDTTVPTLVSTTPADDASAVSVSANLVFTFSEAVQRGSGNIVISNANGSVAQTIAVSDTALVTITGATVTVNPASDLAPSSGYHVNFGSGVIRDLAGNNFAGIAGTTAFNFTTGGDDFPATTATTGLVAVGGAARSGSIEVAGDVDFFRVELVSGTTYVFNLIGNTAGSTLLDPYLFLYTASGSAVTQVASDDDTGDGLNSLITYTATSNGSHYLGASGFSSNTGSYLLSASVSDAQAPTLVSTNPADNAAGVAVGANMVLNFNEPVQRGSGNVLIYNSNGTVARTIAITDTAQVAVSGSQITVNPSADLAAGSGYYVNIAAGVVEDLAGNDFAGIGTSTAFNFTTALVGNNPPVSSNGAVQLTEDGAVNGTLPAATDANSDPITYARVSEAANGSVTVNANGSFSYQPNADFAGNDSFQFSVSDNQGGSNSYTLSLTVSPVNDAPVLAQALPDQNATEGVSYGYTVPAGTFTDVDNATLTYSATLTSGAALPSWLAFNASTRSFSGTAPRGAAGTVAVRVTASDGALSANDSFNLLIAAAPNFAPTASNGNVTLAEDSVLSGQLPSANDANGDSVTYARTAAPTRGSVTVNANGSYSYTPQANYNGSDSFGFSVSDGLGGTNSYTVNLSITPVNDPVQGNVVITGNPVVANELTATPTFTDVDGLGAFSYQWLRGGVAIAGATGATYRVQTGDVGATLSVRVSYSDGGGTIESMGSAQTAAVDPGLNQISGTNGEDRLRGTSGNDSMAGFSGNDVLYGGAGSDILDGGSGLDVANYIGMPQAINANFLTGLVTQGSDTDRLIGIEALFGSKGADTIRGADGPANASGETFRGGEGSDIIDGGTGVDTAEYIGARVGGYTVSRSGNVITVLDTNPGNGAEGQDQLTNIERLLFADKLLAFGTRAEDVARVAFVLWTPGIVNSSDLFGYGLAFYDRGGYTFQELCNAALTYWTGVVGNQAFAQHITKWVPQGTPTKSQAELLAIMAAAPDPWTGRINALEAMAFDSATTAAIENSGVRTNGVVADLTYPGFGTLFELIPGG